MRHLAVVMRVQKASNGGKLIFQSWGVSNNRSHALWTTLGFTWISNDVEPPAPVYWWQAEHPIFTYPESVPEFTNPESADFRVYGQHVEPLSGFEAIAGYSTPGAEPNEAALIVGNDGRTLFKGFLDVQNNADLDADSSPDGVELWTNLIVALESALSGSRQWASAVPDSGIVPPNSSVTFDVVFDAINLTGPNGFEVTVSGDSYNLPVQPGRYDFTVSADGYFSQTVIIIVTQGTTVTTDFALLKLTETLSIYIPVLMK